MKRFVLCMMMAVIVLFSLSGCNDNPRIARSVEEEFARILDIDGEDTIFNFETIQKLQIKMSVEISSPQILEQNQNKPVLNTLVFQLDKTNPSKIKSYTKINYASLIALYNQDPAKRIIMDETIYSFKDNQSSIGGYFSSYTEYVAKDPQMPDAYFPVSIKLFPIENLEGLDGKRNFGTYTITASAKQEAQAEFLEWFISFFRVVSLKNINEKYNYFNPDTVSNIMFEIKSSAVQLKEVNVSFTADGNASIAGSPITITAKSVFTKAGFNVGEIKD